VLRAEVDVVLKLEGLGNMAVVLKRQGTEQLGCLDAQGFH
jgi:hypothetical protein